MYLTIAGQLCGIVRHLSSVGNSGGIIIDHFWPGELGSWTEICFCTGWISIGVTTFTSIDSL